MTAIENSILIALGSNLSHIFWGNPASILSSAIHFLRQKSIFTHVCSSIWSSISWPDPREPRFANAVIIVKTQLSSLELLNELHSVELVFGRERSRPNAPRTLDLDLLAYGKEIRTGLGGLILPHPRLHQREFVLRPLAEICPDWQHPVTGQRAGELLAALGPTGACRLWNAEDPAPSQPAACLCQEDFL